MILLSEIANLKSFWALLTSNSDFISILKIFGRGQETSWEDSLELLLVWKLERGNVYWIRFSLFRLIYTHYHFLHSRCYNNKIRYLHKRCLRFIYNGKRVSYEELLQKKYESIFMHHKSIPELANEMFKVKNVLAISVSSVILPKVLLIFMIWYFFVIYVDFNLLLISDSVLVDLF